MPRDGSGIYSKAAGTTAIPNSTIESAKYNSQVDDMVADLNAARPITAGGTGATTAAGALAALGGLPLSGGTVPDYVAGLITANNGSWGIDIGVGSYKGNGQFVTNGSTFTKTLNNVWAAGSGNGGRDTATAVTANTTYHLFALRNNTTGAFDAVFAPTGSTTVPSGYTFVGRIGSYYTNPGNTALTPFTQKNSAFYVQHSTWFTIAGSVADSLQTIPVAFPCPSGVSVLMTAASSITTTSNGANITAVIGDADGFTIADLPVIRNVVGVAGAQATAFAGGQVRSNTSRQLRFGSSFGVGTGSVTTFIGGWVDYTIPRVS